MKKFIYKIFYFFIPILIISISEAFILPPDFFTYRIHPALTFRFLPQQLIPGIHYPQYKLEMNEVGDLSYRTKRAVVKKNTWITDERGYRNDKFISNPVILLIGDSFFGGSGLSQQETIANKLNQKFHNTTSAYNMAGGSLTKFDVFYRNGIMKKPKLIIYEVAEKTNVYYPFPKKSSFVKKIEDLKSKIPPFANNVFVRVDRLLRFYSFQWLKARIYGETGKGIVSPFDSTIIFGEGNSTLVHSSNDLKAAVNEILSYKKYCDSIGCDFLFLPIPSKETIYFDLVPLTTQPNYLSKLDSLLNLNGVHTINTIDIYNKERCANNSLLYLEDDTHWNAKATELISTEIIKYTSTHLNIKPK